jgi:hypothetical protein
MIGKMALALALCLASANASAGVKWISRANCVMIVSLAALGLASSAVHAAPVIEKVAEPASRIVGAASTAHALQQGVDMARISTAPGVHIVPLDESPYRGALANTIRREIRSQATHGSYIPESGEVPDLRSWLDRAPSAIMLRTALDGTYGSVAEARPHLQFAPASVEKTILHSARLARVDTAGGVSEGRWSGVTRTWDVAGLGIVKLDESEFKTTGGSITLVREWLNTTVSGRPASIKTMRGHSGGTLVSVAWTTDSTSYRLDLQPTDEGAIELNQQRLLEMANAIREV